MAAEITDSELIRQLETFGEKITVKIPLTEIKRGVLVKKLNHLRIRNRVNNASRKSPPASTRFNQIAAYSSDESDIGDERSSVSTTRRSKLSTRSSRQRNVADGDFKIPNRPALRSRNSGQFSPQIDNESNAARKTVITKTTDIKHKNDKVVPHTSGALLSRFKRSSGRSPLKNSSQDSDSNLDGSDTDVDVDESDGSLYQVENKSMNTSFPFNESLEISLAGGPERKSGYWHRVASPTLTKTLLPGKTSTPTVFLHSTNRTNNDSISLSSSPGVNHVGPWAESKSPKSHVNKPSTRAKSRSESHDKYSYSHYISKVLVVIAVLFFIVVGLLYVGFHHSYSVDTKSENNWLICPHSGSASSYCKEGYDQKLVKHAFSAISPLYDLLSTRLGDADCGLASNPNMSFEELKEFIKVTLPQKPFEVSKVAHVVIDLIIHNEHWNLRALTLNGETAQHKDVAQAVVCTEASRRLACRVQQAMQKVFAQLMFWGGVIVASAVFIGFGLMYVRFHLRKLQEQQKDVYNIVEKILDILRQHTEHCEENNAEPYLPIQHVRDMIIPPAKRKVMQPIWDRAVSFIASHESRIRVENQCVQGEEFLVWRWLQSFPNGGKVWQGQAFGEHEIGANLPPYSPTQCLKIRNMFDADVENDENFMTNVQDAILEKCNEAAIVHVLVDKHSKEGCVYLKCTDPTEAGKAYKCLHGWWFDGKLVTVKYLRLEHYHDRFPDSISTVNPLTPSTDRNLSLSQPFHRSSLEMT